MQKATRAVLIAQLVHQGRGQAALGRAHGVDVPLWCIAVVDRHKGGFAAHGQAHVAGIQRLVHLLAQGHYCLPLVVGVGLGHARGFQEAGHRHVVAELDLALVNAAFNRRGARGLGRAGQWNMAFAGQQARGSVQPDPAGTGQVDLAPGVQVGKVHLGAAGAVQRLDIGRELDQVARDKARRQTAVAQQLHHQPGRVAAGARAQSQGFFRRLHTGLHADQIADVLVHHLVHRHQKVDAAALAQVDACQAGLEQVARRLSRQVGRQLLRQQGLVLKRVVVGAGLQKEIKRVVDRHLHHQSDRHLELGGRFGEHQPRLVVGKRVLLPIDEVAGRLDLERIRDDFAAAMWRRAQPNHLRT